MRAYLRGGTVDKSGRKKEVERKEAEARCNARWAKSMRSGKRNERGE